MATVHRSRKQSVIADVDTHSGETEAACLDTVKGANDVRVKAVCPEEQALRELAEGGIRFALLRRPPRWEDAGDIDILAPDADAVEKRLLGSGYLRYSASPSSRKYLRYDYPFQRWIHLDVQPTLFFGAIEAPHPFLESLLNAVRILEQGIPCLDPVDEALLLLFHLGLDKGRLRSKYCDALHCLTPEAVASRREKYAFLPKPLDEYARLFNAARTGTLRERVVVNSIRRSFRLTRSRRSVWSIAKGAGRRIGRLFRGPNPIIFVGPDGSGKSTLTEPLGRLRWPVVRRQYMGPARESEMHAVFKVTMRFSDRLRRRFGKTNPIGFMARLCWQLSCYGDYLYRLYRHMPLWSRNGVVIFDRYACDMYFRKPTKWNDLLFIRMFPRPRFAYLCMGDPKAIHQRKPELSPEEIEQTIELYRSQCGRYRIPYKEVKTTGASPEAALLQVLQDLMDTDWFRSST